MNNHLSISLLCLALLLCTSQVLAAPDDTQQAWLDRVEVRADWDVATSVEGIEPKNHLAGLFQTYFLAATQRVTVRVPTGERLGVYRMNGPIDPQEFEFSWSNGSGLFASLSPVAGHDEHSLITTPPTNGETLIRITRKQNTKGKIELALFTSREANRLLATSYRNILAPLSAAPALRLKDGSRKYDYWHTDTETPLQIAVNGATRIKLDSRLLLPAQGGPVSDSYRISASLDGNPWKVFDLATLLDTTADITVEGISKPMGRPAYAFLDVPDGHHSLALHVRRPMLLRLLARQQPDDYLYRGNHPIDYQGTIGSTRNTASDAFFWNRASAESVPGNFAQPSAQTYLDAVRVGKDNSHRLGGAGAVMPLGEWAWRYPRQPQYQSIATRRKLEFTFFRSLLPQPGKESASNTFAWFLTPLLKETPSPIYFPENYAGRLAGALASGYFAALPSAPDGNQRSREFLIPEQAQSRQLRISVDRSNLSSAETFYVQLDEAEPVRFRVENTRVMRAGEFQPNTGAMALALLQRQHDTQAATLSGAFGARRTAAPLVNAGFLELLLTKPVRKVRMWRQSTGPQPIRVALAYRTSSWYQLSESAYLDLLKVLGAPAAHNLFRKALSALPLRGMKYDLPGSQEKLPAISMQQDMDRDLYNQWEPLLRFLYARYSLFTSGVADTATGQERTALAPDNFELKQIVQQAEVADASAHWQVALEKWGQVYRITDGKLQARARSRQAHALLQSGNDFLARQLLRRDFIYARQSLLRQQALEKLIDLATAQRDAEMVLTLRTVAALRNPDGSNLQHLAASFIETGRSRFAMNVLLGIPQNQLPVALALQVSYDLGWWQWFEQTLKTSHDQKLNSLWQGYRAQLNGDYQRTVKYWREAGSNGQELSQLLTEGLEIRHGLGSSDQGIRRQSIFDWEEWQNRMAGPKTWSDISQSVTHHNGALPVYSTSLGEFSNRYSATPENPVTVSVYGPISLQFEIRLLHDSPNGKPVNDWITIVTDGVERRYPVIDNQVASSLKLTADNLRFAGKKVIIPHEIPAGYHELQLGSQKNDFLMGITARRARFPLTVLPPLNPYTVRSALSGELGSYTPLTDTGHPDSIKVHVTGSHRKAANIALSPLLADQQENVQTPLVITPENTDWLRELDTDRARLTDQKSPANHPPSLQTQLIKLLWKAEQNPGQHLAALSEAEALAQTRPRAIPDQPGTASTLRQLRRGASWNLVRSAQQSAGVRQIDFTGWQPEAPETRTRKAIMGLATDDAQLISGYDTRVLSMYNISPLALTIELSVHDAAYRPAQPVRVLIALDDQPESEILLSEKEPATTLTKRIGTGNHVLRIRLAEPVPNQFLRIKFTEQRGQTSTVASTARQRSYMVATSDQPLVLLQQGPTRLRIDEWRDGETLVNYRTLEPGWQKVIIPVESGREEALLRVFQRHLAPGKTVAISKPAANIVLPVADPWWPAEQFPQPLDRPATEPLAKDLLDGTWSLLGGWVSRRIVDDEPLVPAAAEKFVLLGGAYRKYSTRWDSYFYADSRLRIHQEGDPTLASRAAVAVRRPQWPLNLDVSGSFFGQRFDISGQLETATTIRARLSRTLQINEKISHRPSISVFQRWLSLDELSVIDSEKVDQDVFTRYKREHLRGLRIGDRIQYRPWLDTILYADGYAASNENMNAFDPDHLGLHLGARQLIQDLNLGVRYSRFEYFKDSDRSRASTTQRLRFDLGYTRWFSSRYGLQGNLSYEYDQGSGDSSIYLTLSLNRSNGRYFRDFRPGELDFSWLRERRLLEQRANSGIEQAHQ